MKELTQPTHDVFCPISALDGFEGNVESIERAD
jgi:hypothetical protein